MRLVFGELAPKLALELFGAALVLDDGAPPDALATPSKVHPPLVAAVRTLDFGISQAVTRAAQSLSAEERFLLEEAAGEYIAQLSRAN